MTSTSTNASPTYDPRREERLARRTLTADGRWYAPDARHGTPSGYKYWGCRCTPCTGAASAANYVQLNPPAGTVTPRTRRSAEVNRALLAERRRALREERAQFLVLRDGVWVTTAENVEHGLTSTYNDWSCRCADCTAAVRENVRRQRQRNVMNELIALRMRESAADADTADNDNDDDAVAADDN